MKIKKIIHSKGVIGKKYIFLLFALFSFLLILGGYFYYTVEANDIRSEKYDYLRTIADYKIDQILRWRKERMSDAQHFSASPLYVKAIENLLHTRNMQQEKEISNRNRMIKDLRGYEAVFIATADSVGYFSANSKQERIDPILANYIDSAYVYRKIFFSDFYYNAFTKQVRLAIVSPMINNAGNVIATLVFLINPEQYFYPLVQATLMPGNTSEIAIVRRNGDSILYINQLRHLPNAAFRYSISLTNTQLPAVQAVLGREGMFEGKDYRNINVLADIRLIKSTNWYIITKVDKAEIFSELTFRAFATIIIVFILIILSITAITVLFIFNRRKQDRDTLAEIKHTNDLLNRAEFISKSGNWEVHLNSGSVYGSQGAQRIYGLDGEQWSLAEIKQISLPQYWEMLDQAFLSLVKHNVPYDIEFKIKQANADKIIDVRSVGAYDSENKIIYGTIQDITDVKKQEELLREKDLVFQSLLDFSPIYIFFKDHNIRTLYLSRNYEQLLGIPMHDLTGKTMDELFPSDLSKQMILDDKQVLTNDQMVEVEEEFNGRIYTTIKFPIKREGLPPMLAGFTLDITDRKKAEQELLVARNRAERSDKLKEAFLQNMSHEIRTPLNAIVGFSELLNDPVLSGEKHQNYTSIIINSSNQLLAIVNDILTVARIQTGQETTAFLPININTTLSNLYHIFATKAKEKGIKLTVTLQFTDLDAEIITDATKLNQILSNLISNALKFTHQGRVEFGYKLLSNELEFYVTDTGIGINKEQQEHIFERFAQADGTISKKYGGTGLGLSISKAYAKLLGGKIWVNSAPDEGSTFYFTIPYTPKKIETIHDQNIIHYQVLGEKIILVAEDEEFNFQLIREFLPDGKYSILHAKNGKEAVDICRNNSQIMLVLMDIKMPEMDGQEATRIIKGFRPDLPIIAQTAYALTSEREEFMKCGFDDYITKPIHKEEFLKKVDKY